MARIISQRERTVGSSSEALAASSMNAALSGGSSSSLSRAFCAWVFIVSASMRSTRASGKRSFSSCSTRCVPGVSVNSSSPPQTGQVPVILTDAPQ